jgi:hypothetical protein
MCVKFLPDVRKTFGWAPVGAGHAREHFFAGMARSYIHAVLDELE